MKRSNEDSKKENKKKNTGNSRCATTIEAGPKKDISPAKSNKESEIDLQKTTIVSPAESPANRLLIEQPSSSDRPKLQVIHNANFERERRHNPEGRRGRFAEKTPPGTRTKMLKIIYDRKSELQEKRRNYLIVKIVLGVVALASIFYAGKQTYEYGVNTAREIVAYVEFDKWWNNVSASRNAFHFQQARSIKTNGRIAKKLTPRSSNPTLQKRSQLGPSKRITQSKDGAWKRNTAKKPLSKPVAKAKKSK